MDYCTLFIVAARECGDVIIGVQEAGTSLDTMAYARIFAGFLNLPDVRD